DKLYVPIANFHLLSRYAGASSENAPLHRLGTDQWEKIKKKAAAKIRDVAAELLDVQARRSANTGIVIPPPDADYLTFAAAFQFEETPDQQQAITAVLTDLSSTQPMDRVICGDVGFGKTEVAMRAAFQTVQGGYQVVLLTPTTLLTEQHYHTFSDRFADWPITINSLSRFRTSKQQNFIIDNLANGRIDIIIGTHKLLQSEIKFQNLGLVIVDEEHRFGVRHKERLKALKAEVNILTLTATPIPRTLNMSLAGIRDLSIIATPPIDRHPIKTFVTPLSDALIVEACQRELKRGGQVYFLHNDIKSIETMATKLRNLLPTARCEIAHGKMRESNLERVMRDFYHQRF
ncbi:transcription-repair coupling factor, partial [Achromatium sp. WMS1]